MPTIVEQHAASKVVRGKWISIQSTKLSSNQSPHLQTDAVSVNCKVVRKGKLKQCDELMKYDFKLDTAPF